MATQLLLVVLALGSGSLVSGGAHPKNSTLHQLAEHLLLNYNRGVRPVRDWTIATTVSIDLIVCAVLDVDGQNQKLTTSIWFREMWTDEFLAWNASTYGGIREVSIPLSAIWVPDIIINELVEEGRSQSLPYVYVNSSGIIWNKKPMQVISACNLEMYAFPFDIQNCTLTFSSWLHTVKDLNLAIRRIYQKKDQQLFMNDGEWELLDVPSRYKIVSEPGGDFAQVQFNIVIRRRPLLYIVSLLIPSVFLMLADLMSFYLPANSGTRIMFKTSILVGYTVFRVNITDELPVTAIKTPLIGVFFAVCMGLLVLSLAKSILIVKFFSADEEESKDLLPASCRHLSNGGSDTDDQESDMKTLKSRTESVDMPFVEETEDCAAQKNELGNADSETKGLIEEILEDVICISTSLLKAEESSLHVQWLVLCYRLDTLLFRAYLFIFVTYAATLGSLWVVWHSQNGFQQ
ncbi:5-hydroxytryptamine receptor 3B [Pleurodeles waltl]|uniref:5-hydroxytryptamine receptor 3B n=1 Tax=Pleurodeles waltl TaxID=8319 RepID=UPI003709821F